jgi:L-rhamnose mutarotase
MTTQRRLVLTQLRPECVSQYKQLHTQVWPELLEAYRDAGIHQICCFVQGTTLAVFIETDVEIYSRKKDRLDRNPVEIRWQTIMNSLKDQSIPPLSMDEVFIMTDKERNG